MIYDALGAAFPFHQGGKSMNEPRVMISPPQYTLWRKLAYSFGTDPEISVRDPYEKNNITFIKVVVQDPNRASAVAGVLIPEYNFGGILVRVKVIDSEGNLVEPPDVGQPGFSVRQMIETALFANPYFYEVIPCRAPNQPNQVLTAVFYPKVIQFWNDDLSDYFGYAHFVAEDVFSDVMRHKYDDGTTLNFTTIAGRTFL